MKIVRVFVVTSLLLCFFSPTDGAKKAQITCKRYFRRLLSNGKETMICPSLFRPVCGTDGRTYNSKCRICKYNLEYDDNIGIKFIGKCS